MFITYPKVFDRVPVQLKYYKLIVLIVNQQYFRAVGTNIDAKFIFKQCNINSRIILYRHKLLHLLTKKGK